MRAPPGPPYVEIWMMMRDRSCARRCGSAAHDLNRAQQVGTDLVGEFLDRTEKATFHLLESGKVPGAKKFGGTWTLDTELFARAFHGHEQCAA